MSGVQQLLSGATHLLKGDEQVPLSDLKGVVAFYFSAHWCPPCRGFTPKLAEWYKADLENKGLTVVFVSSDRDVAAFNDYYKEMPWLALPYEARDVKDSLSKKFKVSGIPALVIVDENGSVITKDGRAAVSEDPKGAKFPWIPPTLEDVLKTLQIRDKQGELVSLDSLNDKILGFYFSAHWCPPCRGFTPELVKTYQKLKESGEPFEIIFVSSDRDKDSWKEYYGSMPWMALDYDQRGEKDTLSKFFGVEGIPALAVVDKDRSVITANARGAVGGDPDGKDFPWHPKPVNFLENSADGIDETPSVCALVEDLSEDDKKSLEAAMTKIAKEYMDEAKAKGDDPAFRFFIAGKAGNVVGQVRKLAGGLTGAQLLLLDIPDNGGYYTADAAKFDEDSMRAFLKGYQDKSIARKQLQK